MRQNSIIQNQLMTWACIRNYHVKKWIKMNHKTDNINIMYKTSAPDETRLTLRFHTNFILNFILKQTNWTACADFPSVVAAGRCYANAASDAMFCRPAWFCLHFASGYDPQIRTQPRSLCNAPTPKFHQPMFTRSEVIVLTHTQTHSQTHPQTDSGENIKRSSLRYDVG